MKPILDEEKFKRMEQLAKEFKVNCTYVSTIDQSKLAVLQDTRAFMWNAWNLADIMLV